MRKRSAAMATEDAAVADTSVAATTAATTAKRHQPRQQQQIPTTTTATRKSLAARGNIQACKSIKATNDRRRLYMKRRRDYQRVVAQQIALGENAAPWGALAASLEHEENVD
jgi:hypothetical protein